MVRFRSSVWTCVLFVVLATLPLCSAQAIGVNWGTISTRPLPAKSVVQLLKDNNFTKVKLFDVDDKVLTALGGSGIEVMVAAPNEMLLTLQSLSKARDWVKYNVSQYREKKNVNIAYAAIGNEPFLTTYNDSYVNLVLPALQNVQQAIVEAKLQGIVKVVVPMNADVLSETSNLPSQTTFKDKYLNLMSQIVSLLNNQGSPFIVNLYPYLSLVGNPDFPKDFAFLNGNSSAAFSDGDFRYANVLEASIDQVANALASVGAPNMPIVLGEVGWPTNGEARATIDNAKEFNQGLLNHFLQLKGTPRHPNTFFNFYLFGLLDEDAKSISPGNFERHWGIFDYAGQAKYSLDLSGRGLNVPLVNAHVQFLGKKWCVVKDGSTATGLQANLNYACGNGADCTVIGDGGSCHDLPMAGMASYAFNSYYQAQGQQDYACDFQNLATVTTTNPNLTYNCPFTLAISTSSSRSSMPVVANCVYAVFGVFLAVAFQLQV